jgi:hypothetical protein
MDKAWPDSSRTNQRRPDTFRGIRSALERGGNQISGAVDLFKYSHCEVGQSHYFCTKEKSRHLRTILGSGWYHGTSAVKLLQHVNVSHRHDGIIVSFRIYPETRHNTCNNSISHRTTHYCSNQENLPHRDLGITITQL